MLISFRDRGPIQQPGRLQLQATFARLGIPFTVGLDDQTQAGVFTDGTEFAHGTKAKLPEAGAARQDSERWKSGKKAINDLKWSFEPCVAGLQERFLRCQKRESIQTTNKSGCNAHAAPGLKRARLTRATSTWKFVLPATRFSPASKSWSIRQAVSNVSAASMPSLIAARLRRPRLPRLSKRGWSRRKASGNGGLCRVRA
jgi:hypothetical protein